MNALAAAAARKLKQKTAPPILEGDDPPTTPAPITTQDAAPTLQLETAIILAGYGLYLFPLRENGKEPPPGFMDWERQASNDPDQLRAWAIQYSNCNFAIAPARSGDTTIDLDMKGGKKGIAELKRLCIAHGIKFSRLLQVRTPTGGRHLFVRGLSPSSNGRVAPGIDIKSRGGYVVAPGSVIDGKRYEISGPIENFAERPEAPTGLLALFAVPEREVRKAKEGAEQDSPSSILRAQTLIAGYINAGDVAVENRHGDDRTYRLFAELRGFNLSDEKILEIAEPWRLECKPAWGPDEFRNLLEHANAYAQNEAGADYVAPVAERIAPEILERLRQESIDSAPERKDVAVVEGEIDFSVPGSEDDIAIAFARFYSSNFKYVPEKNEWRAFNGQRWSQSSTPVIWNILLPIARSVANQFENASTKRKITSRSTVANAEALLRGNPSVMVPMAQWDSDPWLLNTCGKIVDLRTGEQRDIGPTDYFMKSTAVEAAPEATCPVFFKFLHKITNGDTELQSYLQRMIGYCLTGRTTEHALFFAYGTGGNGKGSLFNTVTYILGDYARVAPVGMFTVSLSERHPTDMAMLAGARAVVGQETEQGKYWDETKIKALTGGDPISARYMRQDFFEYVPQFKLIVAGNHKPKLKNVDEAIRRRLHLVPFTVTIPETERDPELSEKLKAEWPGILRWAIKGCLAWQEHGLKPPAAVLKATGDYFGDQDPLESWLEDRCDLGKGWTASAALYGDFCAHFRAENGNAPPDGRKAFTQRMESRGFVAKKGAGKASVRGFANITLKPAAPFDEGEFL